MKILGREPALWLALVGALVSALSTFILHLSITQVGTVNAVAALVIGLVTAFVTHDGQSAAILGLAHGLVALALSFGAHVSTDQQTVLYTLIASVVAMFVRTQATAPVSAGDTQ